jgi:hypothetical protein
MFTVQRVQRVTANVASRAGTAKWVSILRRLNSYYCDGLHEDLGCHYEGSIGLSVLCIDDKMERS